ncbi:hypothetical protein HK101_009037 [Irineochytrium annulatum]|nr:hypothetical protein HK101_009037 [Irineochytrium annulatum]
MQKDHENARYLADGLEKLGFHLTKRLDTNMVWVDTTPLGVSVNELRDELAKHNIRIFGGDIGECRWVTHLQTPREAIEKTLSLLGTFIASRSSK